MAYPRFEREGLTQREKEVVALVAEGQSAKEVACSLHIAPRTVDQHLENARLKLRSRNRAHLVAHSIKLGLVAGGEGRFARCQDCLFRNEIRATFENDAERDPFANLMFGDQRD